MNYQHAHRELTGSKIFTQWEKEHSNAYLSHFYTSLSQEFQTGTWEIGFYHPDHDKITVFVISKPIEIKPESEVFKEKGTVEKLDVQKVLISQEDALKTFHGMKNEKYSDEHLLKGFIIIQKFNNRILWNISFVTKSMKILNVKIDANTGDVISDNLITVVQQK